MSKKAILSFFIGLVLFLIGLTQILKITLPFSLNRLHLEILIALGGLFLFYDSFSIGHNITKLLSILAGILIALLGLIPLLIELNLLTMLPFIAVLKINTLMLQSILIIFGLYLMIDSFIMY